MTASQGDGARIVTCIVNCLPLNEEERQRFILAAGDVRQEFVGDGSSREGMNWKASIPENLRESASAIIGNVPVEQIRDCTSLEWLQTFSAGVDAYLKEGVLAPGVKVSSASGAYGLAVSEHLFAMMMALMKNLPSYRDLQREHQWSPLGRVQSPDGATVLVLGTGDIGAHFARLCKACGAHTVGVRRDAGKQVEGIDEMHAFEELDTLLGAADVIALALPSTPETRHIIDESRLRLMKSDAMVINAGRGDAIDCDALATALHEQRISSAGLDVTDPEPLPAEHTLWNESRCLITPHVAGGTHLKQTADRIIDIALENVRRYVRGEDLLNRMR